MSQTRQVTVMHRYPKFMQMIDTAWRLQEHAGCRQRHSWGRFQQDGCCCGAAVGCCCVSKDMWSLRRGGESERAVRLPNTLLATLTLKRQGVSVPLRPGEDACKRRGLMPRTASNRRRKRLPRRRKIRYINSQLPCDSEMNSTAGYIAICAPDAARLAPRNSPSATNHSGLGLGALLCPAF